MDTTIFLTNLPLDNTKTLQFFFKAEDFNQDGIPIGPLWGACDDGEVARSDRYVSIVEAKHIARHFNSELTEK